MPSIRLRAATLSDVPTVQRLAHAIWHEHYPSIISRAQIDYMLARGYSDEVLAEYVTDPARGLVLAEDEGEPVGFVAWYPPGEPATLKLDKLYVLPRLHGKGIGRVLIEHVADVARAAGCRALILNVNRNNAGAIRAYERCGFAVREAGDFPIGDGFYMEDYIMSRALDARA